MSVTVCCKKNITWLSGPRKPLVCLIVRGHCQIPGVPSWNKLKGKMHPCFALFLYQCLSSSTIACPETVVHTTASSFSGFRLTGAPVVQGFQNSDNNNFLATRNMWADPQEKTKQNICTIFQCVWPQYLLLKHKKCVQRGTWVQQYKNVKRIELEMWIN